MRRSDLATIVKLVIPIIVALRTRSQCPCCRTELRTSMFRMTINTTNARNLMRLDHRRRERRGTMTRRTALLHAARQRVAISTRAGVWRSRN